MLPASVPTHTTYGCRFLGTPQNKSIIYDIMRYMNLYNYKCYDYYVYAHADHALQGCPPKTAANWQ